VVRENVCELKMKSTGGIAAVPREASQGQHAAMQLDPRPARPDVLYAIEDNVRRAYSLYVSRIGRAPGPMLDDYGSLIDDGRVHVVERDGAILGILVLIPEKEAMLLDNVAVAPSAQGSGLGRRMLECAEQTARETGYRFIKLYTIEPRVCFDTDCPFPFGQNYQFESYSRE
jgi:GNAT superfamily N-acetyltransferase